MSSGPPKTPVVSPPSAPDEVAAPPKARKRPLNDLAKLRERAKKAGAAARASIPLQLSVTKEIYAELVELCEEYHLPIRAIARQCMIDGMRKYRDFSTPGLNPLPVTPGRVLPEYPGALYRPPNAPEITPEAQQVIESNQAPYIPEWMRPNGGKDPVEIGGDELVEDDLGDDIAPKDS